MAEEGKRRKSADPASQEMIDYSESKGYELAWDRFEAQEPQCDFGKLGLCCKNCVLGPCRIDPFGEGADRGVCGATADVIAARNFARHVASGAAAHSDHGRDIVHTLMLTAQGEAEGYELKNTAKLHAIADEFGLDTEGKDDEEIAREVAEMAMADFGRQEGTLRLAERAPAGTRERWEEQGTVPTGVDADIVRLMHATHIGVDNEPHHIMRTAIRAALSDGWGGSMYATDFSDVLFGGPDPIRASSNLGVLEPGSVNVIVHGHEPTLSEMIVAATHDPELKKKAEEAGADGIQISGICCTANEILMRHGIPVAGNFLQQELALATGAVDAMIVDVQCIMPAIADFADCMPTKLISTSPKAQFSGIEHIEFEEARGLSIAKEIVEQAIEAFQERDASAVHIPEDKTDMVAGFTVESIVDMLSGQYGTGLRPLVNAIVDGRVRGIAGVVGCNNVKQVHDECHTEMVKDLIKNDVLVVQTGCSAIACGKAGLMKPEAAFEYAGEGLKEVCAAVGIPPVVHVGSCVDNSRILVACAAIAEAAGADDISVLPVAGAAPEWMSEKAISIATYVAASGIYTVCAEPFPVMGSKAVREYLTDGMEKDFGGKLAFERDPHKAADLMIEHMNKKREGLGLGGMMYGEAEEEEVKETAEASTSS